MNLNELLEKRNMTKYRLSKLSGVPFATISDISTGKSAIEKCSGDTLYKLSRALGVTMEELLGVDEQRASFEGFKSNVCHMVKIMGDIGFITHIVETNEVLRYYIKEWYAECLYMLAMLDYLCRENGLPLCADYKFLRSARLPETLYPSGILVMCAAAQSDKPKEDSIKRAIPEFLRFNIVESEVRNVC